jgi:hypothetical protein
MIQIQQHFFEQPRGTGYKYKYKVVFFMKEGDNKSKKISKAKYMKLHDESWGNKEIKVLAPMYRDLK